jgi:hypothetical protein
MTKKNTILCEKADYKTILTAGFLCYILFKRFGGYTVK